MPGNPHFDKAPPDKGASSFIYPPTAANLEFFAQVLRQGGLVAIPTETVYGLAALALDQAACRTIFQVKGRPLVDPLIIHLADASKVQAIAEVPDSLEKLAEAFWPGPLTLILNKKQIVPGLVTAGRPTVAVRVPSHPVTHALLQLLDQPLAAPSANPFGYISPTCAEHVAESFAGLVPYIIDGGPCEVGVESTILDLSGKEYPTILRPGAISADSIAHVLARQVHQKDSHLGKGEAATAPGTYIRHYSPQTRLCLFKEGQQPPQVQSDEAVILLTRTDSGSRKNIFWLTEDGSLNSAARTLYTLLRQVDKLGYRRIHCELPAPRPDGIAVALRDRLKRAAAK